MQQQQKQNYFKNAILELDCALQIGFPQRKGGKEKKYNTIFNCYCESIDGRAMFCHWPGLLAVGSGGLWGSSGSGESLAGGLIAKCQASGWPEYSGFTRFETFRKELCCEQLFVFLIDCFELTFIADSKFRRKVAL